MNGRELLRGQSWRAWQEVISNHYLQQLIVSERALQSYFCERIRYEFSQKQRLTRRLLLEPKLKNLASHERFQPDILVCDHEKVIAVIELKYQPNQRPNFEPDLWKLACIAKDLGRFEVANNRFRGPRVMQEPYRVAPNVLYVWAGVYGSEYIEISTKIDMCIAQQFLALHAVTHVGSLPDVYRSSPSKSGVHVGDLSST